MDNLKSLLQTQPTYRWAQLEAGLFNPAYQQWSDLTNLPKEFRHDLERQVPWSAGRVVKLVAGPDDDVYKALVEAPDQATYETVLMHNERGWTVCVSSQVGCAMGCQFCATGDRGFTRDLEPDEIIDQYRLWNRWLYKHPDRGGRISNIVMMGMGEPLANYESVKTAIHTWLKYTDLGSTRITLSTVGLLPQLEKILIDPDWPHPRIAISLHSAIESKRRQLMPTTAPGLVDQLADWCQRYHRTLGNRRHQLTIEYLLLGGFNDTPADAQALVKFLKRADLPKVNLIIYNAIPGKSFQPSDLATIDAFRASLRSHQVTVTTRRSLGTDISAACGQLAGY